MPDYDIVIRGGRLVTAAEVFDADLAIKDGTIAAIGRNLGPGREEIDARDRASLDIFWLRDESLEDLDNLPDPATLAAEIVEELEAALTEFAEIAESLEP